MKLARCEDARTDHTSSHSAIDRPKSMASLISHRASSIKSSELSPVRRLQAFIFGFECFIVSIVVIVDETFNVDKRVKVHGRVCMILAAGSVYRLPSRPKFDGSGPGEHNRSQ